MEKMMKYSLIFALCLAMLLPACAPKPTAVPTVSPTPVPLPTQVIVLATQAKDMVGIWQVHASSCPDTLFYYYIFRTDGTVTSSCNQDGSHGISGTYWFENQRFLTDLYFCGTTGQYEAQIVLGQDQSKSLSFTLIKDDCEYRPGDLTNQAFLWVAALP
jgi:hypothetical protein